MSKKSNNKFCVRYRSSDKRIYLAPWSITNSKGDESNVYYDYQRDAWEYCKSLARKTRGIAVLTGKDGRVLRQVSYELRARAGSKSAG